MSNHPSTSHEALAHLRHDLRTPINHIIGYSELVQEELEEEGITSCASDLRKVREAAAQLLRMVNSHLSEDGLAALLSGNAPRPRPTDTAALECGVEGHEPAAITGRILVVDDDTGNRETLCRRLERQGHTTAQAANGTEALARLRSEAFDLVLLDVIMPGIDGTATLREMKADRSLRALPVIMISALDELESVVRCIEAGAEDYLSKPFEPTLLRARIGASLEKKNLRDQEQHYLRTIESTQKRLSGELEEAANYVRSILPPPLTEQGLAIDWRFIPSTELGGDSFGYHRLDDEHYALYLLDVCGHGVGAALLSVAASNLLRTLNSGGTDYRDPAAVLALLNEAFPMERHNQMYFTIWYGVWHAPTRTLRHASGGHPPAFLLTPDGSLEELREPGLVVGVMPGIHYNSATCTIPAGSRLFVMSDGTYEIRQPEGMLDYEVFKTFFRDHGRDTGFLDQLSTWVGELNGPGSLSDDFSIVQLDFPA